MDLEPYNEKRKKFKRQFAHLLDRPCSIGGDQIRYIDLKSKRVVLQARQKVVARLDLIPGTKFVKWIWAYTLDLKCARVKHKPLGPYKYYIMRTAEKCRRHRAGTLESCGGQERFYDSLDYRA